MIGVLTVFATTRRFTAVTLAELYIRVVVNSVSSTDGLTSMSTSSLWMLLTLVQVPDELIL